ncbi:MAG: ATP-dependent RecD-like DNA helicase [Acidobacteria bacterium]|nr:ATP-dependent RecD-like DNA helicase [Acidobacteriota bacterium]MBV9478607.1 ATP-dependent RecD-like DNA helicase [Acidobacteriota bacterium]
MSERLVGVVERVPHYATATGFCIADVREQAGALVRVVATCPPLEPGDEVEVLGRHMVHNRFGPQFRAEQVTPRLPVGRAALARYLGSGRVRGIGPALAERLLDEFGEHVIGVLDDAPEKLLRIPGIGPKKLALIRKGWSEQRDVWRLAAMLAEHGIGTGRAARIQKQFGGAAIAVIRQNPYRLAQEVRGIGFATSDAIAQSLGFDRASPFRVRAGLQHLLDEARGAGHCGVPRTKLVDEAVKLLDVDAALATSVLDDALAERSVIAETLENTTLLFTPRLYVAETRIASMLRALASSEAPFSRNDIDALIDTVESDFVLPDEKRRAIALALTNPVCVITGGPGVGKTTVVNAILQIAARAELELALAAPTGRAAKRLAQQTGHPAQTIHRLLEWNPEEDGFQRNEDRPLECDLLVIDEASMCDVLLFESLLRAVDAGTSLLIVGDADQLPSIGPGQVLRDIIDSGTVPVASLTTVYRQSGGSDIVANAHRINRGTLPDLANAPETDFYFFSAATPEAARERIVEIVAERIPRRFGLDPLRDVQVLSPMHKGATGVDELNAALQQRLNPAQRAGRLAFAAGDKVMQTVNNYDKEVFNGDVGIVREIGRDAESVVVDFDRVLVEYVADEIEQLTLAYATTVHKAQGSEFPAVVIPVVAAHSIMLQRNLLYTAVTRGQKLVILVGERAAVERAVRNANAMKRWTRLRHCLRG